jgi:hypothetical protein
MSLGTKYAQYTREEIQAKLLQMLLNLQALHICYLISVHL